MQISYSYTYSIPLNFVCSGTAQKAYSGGQEILCPLSDEYFAEEAACMNNCNNQGSCMGETTRKCYCYEGWTGTHCETRQGSVFTFATADPPMFTPSTTSLTNESSSNNSQLWVSSANILACFLLLAATAI